jgi:polar amino acid transport system substrate-binding protein
VALLLAIGLTACSPAPAPAPTAAPNPTATPASLGVDPALVASLPPLTPFPSPGRMPVGSYMETIYDSGSLIAGVRDDILLFGFLSPRTEQIEGFDVDIAREIARAIFGDPTKLTLKPVTAAERIPALKTGQVDIIAATMTITPERKQEVDFSEVYYVAGQRVLVRKDAPYRGIQDLSGKKICAPRGSILEQDIPRANPQAEVVLADKYSDCLRLLQQGQIEAISSGDVILASLAQQDPNMKVIGGIIAAEPYGLGVAKGRTEFVAFVNAVLEQIKADGRWEDIYNKWLGHLGPPPEPPAGTYRSE